MEEEEPGLCLLVKIRSGGTVSSVAEWLELRGVEIAWDKISRSHAPQLPSGISHQVFPIGGGYRGRGEIYEEGWGRASYHGAITK